MQMSILAYPIYINNNLDLTIFPKASIGPIIIVFKLSI